MIPPCPPLSRRGTLVDVAKRRYNNSTIMEFEFDETKSRANSTKHGIDFVEAQALWEDADLLEIPARTEDEPRTLVIGMIGRKHWSAVVTQRGDRTRFISVRRSRKEEKAIYES